MTSNRLTPFEHEVIATFLSPDHPVLIALRRQLAVCLAGDREFTGHGFFTDLVVPPTAEPAPLIPGKLILGEVGATLDGLDHGAGFLLWIEAGVLQCLEGFAYDQPWPDEIKNYSVFPITPSIGGGSKHDSEKVEDAWDRSAVTGPIG